MADQGVHVVGTDEKTGIQAPERNYPDIPMGPGRVHSREHEPIRHGALCLTADREVWCGWAVAPTPGPARTEQGPAAHVEQTAATGPPAGWVFLCDNLNTHPCVPHFTRAPRSATAVEAVRPAAGTSGGQRWGRRGRWGQFSWDRDAP